MFTCNNEQTKYSKQDNLWRVITQFNALLICLLKKSKFLLFIVKGGLSVNWDVAWSPVAEFRLIFSGNRVTEENKLHENCRHTCSLLFQEINGSCWIQMFLLLSFEQRFGTRSSRFVGDDSISMRANLHCDSEVNIVKIIYLNSGQDPQSILNSGAPVNIKFKTLCLVKAISYFSGGSTWFINETSGPQYRAFLFFGSKITLHRLSE